jgi:formate dehydrogenase subunit beta
MVNLEDLKKEATAVLKDEKVKYVIGYGKSTNGLMPVPVFIKKPEDVEKLVWDPTCIYNLTRFLVDEKRRKAKEKHPDERPVGLIVKGCDSRALVVLLQEKLINRENVYIIGVSCENAGVVDEKKLAKKFKDKKIESIEFDEKDNIIVTATDGKTKIPASEILAERCLECKANFPVIYDILLGEKTKRQPENPFQSIEKAQKIKWLEKSPVLSENFVYHFIRAIHLAGRCIDCAECERVCPLDIPIRFLNKKLEKAAKELFDYDAGFDPDQPSLVASFRDEDPEDFIR